jgi:hypothetical protein
VDLVWGVGVREGREMIARWMLLQASLCVTREIMGGSILLS